MGKTVQWGRGGLHVGNRNCSLGEITDLVKPEVEILGVPILGCGPTG